MNNLVCTPSPRRSPRTPRAFALGGFSARIVTLATLVLFGLGQAAFAKTITIKIDGMNFPPKTEAKKGDTIVWMNNDIVPHTVTSNPDAKQKFDSGMIQSQGKFKLKIKSSGLSPYHCSYHPTMAGEIQAK